MSSHEPGSHLDILSRGVSPGGGGLLVRYQATETLQPHRKNSSFVSVFQNDPSVRAIAWTSRMSTIGQSTILRNGTPDGQRTWLNGLVQSICCRRRSMSNGSTKTLKLKRNLTQCLSYNCDHINGPPKVCLQLVSQDQEHQQQMPHIFDPSDSSKPYQPSSSNTNKHILHLT